MIFEENIPDGALRQSMTLDTQSGSGSTANGEFPPAFSATPTGPAGGDHAGSSYPNLVIASGVVTDAKIGTRTVDPGATIAGTSADNTGLLTALLSRIVRRIGEMIGGDWFGAVPTTLTATAAHIANTSNPHGVTAAQVGAIPTGATFGGVVTGPYGALTFAADMATQAELDTHAGTAATSTLGHVRTGTGSDVAISGGIISLLDGAVTNAKLRSSAALSVIGNGASASATPSDLTAGTDGYVLRRSGAALAFGQVVTAGIADGAITSAKIADGTIVNGDIAGATITPGKMDPAFAIASSGTGMAIIYDGTNAFGVWGYPKAGTLVLPLTQSASSASTLFGLTQTNTGAAAGVVSATINAATNAASAIVATTNGTGRAGSFSITNGASASDAIFATSNGTADAVNAQMTGTIGRAIEGKITSATNSNIAVYAESQGTGTSLEAYKSTTTGKPLHCQIFNGSSTADVALMETNGAGNVLMLNHTGGGTSTTTARNIQIWQAAGVNVARMNNVGKLFVNGGQQVGGADEAWLFTVSGDVTDYENGDVVMMASANGKVTHATTSGGARVIGIVATQPGVIHAPYGATEEDLALMVPIAMLGHVPAKVNTENGSISAWDYLVPSATAGELMKAPSTPALGTVIAQAWEAYSGSGTGTINVIVRKL